MNVRHPRAPMRLLPQLSAFLLAVGLALAPSAANAAQTFFTTEKILREFFPTSERVTYKKLPVDAGKRAKLQQRLGYAPPKGEYVVFVALTGGKVDGYAIIDDERGQHEPITFAVKLSPEAVVQRQEVMVYRESYGAEIVDPRFRAQFVGKSRKDELRAGRDVDVITGATISCRSMALGVRRAIALVEELVLAGAPVAAAPAQPPAQGNP